MAYNTIKLKDQNSVEIELVANAAITPGMFVEEMSTGYVRAHATASGNCLPMVALENELEGQDITTAYAQNDPVKCWIPGRGDEVYAILVSGQNVTRGQFLVSNGDGKLAAVTDSSSFGDDDPLKIVAVAIEAKDASLADKRICVRVV